MILKLTLAGLFSALATAAFAHGGHTDVVAGHSHFAGEYMLELGLFVVALGAVTFAAFKK